MLSSLRLPFYGALVLLCSSSLSKAFLECSFQGAYNADQLVGAFEEVHEPHHLFKTSGKMTMRGSELEGEFVLFSHDHAALLNAGADEYVLNEGGSGMQTDRSTRKWMRLVTAEGPFPMDVVRRFTLRKSGAPSIYLFFQTTLLECDSQVLEKWRV